MEKSKSLELKAPNIELSITGENCALRDNGEKDGLGWQRSGRGASGLKFESHGMITSSV